MPSTIAQNWAQKRNYLKFVLKSAAISRRMFHYVLTEKERVILDKIQESIDAFITDMPNNNAESKANYLKKYASDRFYIQRD